MWHFNHLSVRKSLSMHKLFTLMCQKKTFRSSSVAFEEYQTMQTIQNKLIKLLETDQKYTPNPKPREHLMKYMPKSQTDLPVRKMQDSFDIAIVPLSTDAEMRDKYTTFQGSTRIGRLMEDVDLFAGHIAYKHILNPEIPPGVGVPHVVVTVSVSTKIFNTEIKEMPVWCCTKHLTVPDENGDRPFPYVIVTIRVDHIEMINGFNQVLSDIRISGHVCWVGLSSLEVVIYLDQQQNGKWQRLTKAVLLMAARNPMNTGPGIVNAIQPETPEEQSLLQGGEQRKIRRMQLMHESLLKTKPTEEELNLIHNLFIDTIDPKEVILDKRDLPSDSKWMHDATLNNLVFCHPEHRNLHNKIFGGFLIRQALELSWTTAFLHGMETPKLVHISDIGFYSPVDVGSLLKLYGSVTYAENNFIQVYVFADAFSLSSKELRSTTSFNFTYSFKKNCNKLYPLTYLEGMKYIDGRRHFQEFIQYSSKEQ